MLFCLAYGLAWILLRPLLALLGGIRVYGRERVPRRGPVIFAPNHASYSDPPIHGVACPRAAWYMAKAPLFRRPLLGAYMRALKAFPVDVDHFDRDALRFSEEKLRRGEAICIFPEGGVSDDGRLQPLKPGLALIALRTGAPILPVGLIGTHRLLPPGRAWPGYVPGGVQVRYGEPIDPGAAPAELDRRGQLEWITCQVRDALIRLLPPDQQPQAHS